MLDVRVAPLLGCLFSRSRSRDGKKNVSPAKCQHARFQNSQKVTGGCGGAVSGDCKNRMGPEEIAGPRSLTFNQDLTQSDELAYVLQHDTLESTTWYLVDAKWMREWAHFAKARTGQVPGPIDNTRLVDNRGVPRPGLKPSDDYRGVNKSIWTFWQNRYGGGPVVRRKRIDLYSPPCDEDGVPCTIYVSERGTCPRTQPVELHRCNKASRANCSRSPSPATPSTSPPANGRAMRRASNREHSHSSEVSPARAAHTLVSAMNALFEKQEEINKQIQEKMIALDARCQQAESEAKNFAHVDATQRQHAQSLQRCLHDSEECVEKVLAEKCQSAHQCVVCLQAEASHVVVPCGHLALCAVCSTRTKTHCPICRQRISAILRVHRP